MEIKLEKAGEGKWRIPRGGKMRVDGIVYATEKLLENIRKDEALRQVVNVATLPEIVKASIAMPDIHYGYGFPIGGVAAFPFEDGIVSPGGVGYDINCGVRALIVPVFKEDVEKDLRKIVDSLFERIPAGLGETGPISLDRGELKRVCTEGASWAVNKGFGLKEDLSAIEDEGKVEGADPACVSDHAYERGKDQIGTVGSGNHFVELGYVEKVFDEGVAESFGIKKNMLTVLIHSGSRGFGHQICTDYLNLLQAYGRKKNIELVDRQLIFAYMKDPEGKKYFGAMNSAINYAFANREVISHFVRECLEKILKIPYNNIKLLYDVGHNIAKVEIHNVENKPLRLLVHRKGATRALPAHHEKLPSRYKETGQPVIIPGDMGTSSYILVGEERSLRETFGTVCHGAGRNLSRSQAKKIARGRAIDKELEKEGIIVRSHSRETLAEEMPQAYKDVSDVVEAVVKAGIARKVAQLKPLGVIKG